MSENDSADNRDFWEIERIAKVFEKRLGSGDCSDSIESLLSDYAYLPRHSLLKALVETELDVLGVDSERANDYKTRFPRDIGLIDEIFSLSQETISLPLRDGIMVGTYWIGRLLGKGAVGFVYHAVEQKTGAEVVVKILRPELREKLGASVHDAIAREAQLTSTLKHPRIVQSVELGEYQGLPFHVLDYVNGPTFKEFRGSRLLDPVTAAILIAPIADALHHAHSRGIVHRDVKPTNILIDQNERAHITDFGFALDDSLQGLGHRLVGTPTYMSPEQWVGDSHIVDGRSDIYSLGVVLYEAVSGFHPTRGESVFGSQADPLLLEKEATPIRQRCNVPASFERICMTALARDPRHRFSNAKELAQNLRHFVWQQRFKSLVPYAASIACLIAIGFFLLSNPFSKPPNVNTQTIADGTGPDSSIAFDQLNKVDVVEKQPSIVKSSLPELMSKSIGQLSPEECEFAAGLIIDRFKSDDDSGMELRKYLRSSVDNTIQTALVNRCGPDGLPSDVLLQVFRNSTDSDLRGTSLLALGEYSSEQISVAQREQLLPLLLQAYCTDPSAYVHSASEWLLRRWGYTYELNQVKNCVFVADPHDRFEWYNVVPNLTMIEFWPGKNGYPNDEKPFAMASTEITNWLSDWLNHRSGKLLDSDVAKSPRNVVSWYQCADYCNRLSSISGLEQAQQCYAQNTRGQHRTMTDWSKRAGIRMPTLDEWTFAVRGRTTTRRYWGRSDKWLYHYANCRKGDKIATIPAGSLKPNAFGLFDGLGNVSEWMHLPQARGDDTTKDVLIPIRGGSAWTHPENMQVDADYTFAANDVGQRMGIRVVQSMPEISLVSPGLRMQLDSKYDLVIRRAKGFDDQASIPIEFHTSVFSRASHLLNVIKVRRDQAGHHRLSIKNQSSEPVTLLSLGTEGCVHLNEGMVQKIELRSGEELLAEVEFDSTYPGTHRFLVKLIYQKQQAQDMIQLESFAYISGPVATAVGQGVQANINLDVDFGTVHLGTQVRQSLSLSNVGDEVLHVDAAVTTGAMKLSQVPSEKSIYGQTLASYEYYLESDDEGFVEGTISIPTSDPRNPEVVVRARAQFTTLSIVPVVGIFRRGQWLLDYTLDGTPDRTVSFGEANDLPLVGDWNGDRIPDLAVLRLNRDGTKTIHVRIEREASIDPELRTVALNESNSTVLLADVDGDRFCDIVSVHEPTESNLQTWRIDRNRDGAWDIVESYGFANDLAIMGDWNGDGKYDLGTMRRQSGNRELARWYLQGARADYGIAEFPFGVTQDIPVAADWNGDGKTDPGVFRLIQGVGTFFLDQNRDQASERIIHLGTEGDIPISFMAPPWLQESNSPPVHNSPGNRNSE